MYHDEDGYPYSYEELPDVGQLLHEMDWDAVCVFDAARWDAFTEVTEHTSEPVCSPGSNTPKWTSRVWCNDDYDWSDVTYISGNAQTTVVRNGPDNDKDWSGKIEDHVGEYVEAFRDDDVWADPGTSLPEPLTDVALDYDPPVVIHYMQPHEPFIGGVTAAINLGPPDMRDSFMTGVDERFDDFPTVDWNDVEMQLPNMYYLVIKGLVSPAYIRFAYLTNLSRAWTAARDIRREFDTVISTADHGEQLGIPDNSNEADLIDSEHAEPPAKWGHSPDTDQGRVIPFHLDHEQDEMTLPDPQSVGAAASHEWTLPEH